jgi:ATP-dependent Clp protease protease subunit
MQAREMMYHKTNINCIMSEYTGQTVEQVEADTDRDKYMSPLEAKKYGLIDHIVGGDDAGYQITGDTRAFTAVMEDDEDEIDEIDLRGARFRRALEPYVAPLAPDTPEDRA